MISERWNDYPVVYTILFMVFWIAMVVIAIILPAVLGQITAVIFVNDAEALVLYDIFKGSIAFFAVFIFVYVMDLLRGNCSNKTEA